MTPEAHSSNGASALVSPVRNRYFYGKLLDVRHLEMEQQYLNGKRWLLNRLALGTGVLCGLEVEPTGTNGQVVIRPGMAIDGLGREIVVDRPHVVDPAQLTDACGRPEGDPLERGFVTILLCFHECKTEPAPVLVADCDIHEECEASAVRERFSVVVREADFESFPLPGLTEEECGAIFGPGTPPTGELGSHAYGAGPGPHAAVAHLDLQPAGGPPAGRLRTLRRRRALCAVLERTCEPPDEICVPIALVALAEDDGEPRIEQCISRRTIYSNATLLDLILCVAEECCGQRVLQYESGDAQVGAPEETLEKPLAVRLVDPSGGEVEGEKVTFHVMGGGGTVGPVEGDETFGETYEAEADDQGVAQAAFSLGPDPAGLNTVEATIDGGAGRVTFHALARKEES
jgi:hypothetical protein